jgi:hypothetical protein
MPSTEPSASAATTAESGTDSAKEAEYLAKSFHVRHTDGTIQGPFTGAVVQSLYKHRKLEPYWEISEDQQTWTVVERVSWLKRGFDGAKIGELAGKLGEKSADLQRKAAPVVANLTKRASPFIDRIKQSPKIAIAAALVLLSLLVLLWPRSSGFQGSWVGVAKMPLLGSDMVTVTIDGSAFTMTDQKKDTMIGTLEITGSGEARVLGLIQKRLSPNSKEVTIGTGLARLVGSDRMEIEFPGSLVSVSLNRVK